MNLNTFEDRFFGREHRLLENARLRKLMLQVLQMFAIDLLKGLMFHTSLNERTEHLAVERFIDVIERLFADGSNELLIDIIHTARHQNNLDILILTL